MAHLPADVGVSVIYGKNGAGKTRLLRALTASLRGEAPKSAKLFIHWAIEDPEEMWGGWRETLDKAMSRAYQDDRGWQLAELLRKRDQSFGSEQEEWERDNIGRLLSQLQEEEFSPTTLSEVIYGRYKDVSELLDMDLPPINRLSETLAERVVLGGSLVFEAVGTRAAPEWVVYSSLEMSNDEARAQVALDVERRRDFRRITESARRGEITNQEAIDHIFSGGLPRSSSIPWEPTDDEDDQGAGLVLAMVDYGLQAWPGWASVPLHRLGTIGALPVVVTGDEAEDINVTTREHLARAAGGKVIAAMDGDDVLLSEALAESTQLLQEHANRLLHQLLPQAPRLRFELTNPNEWFTGSRPTWSAVVPSGPLPLESLSEAESKWSRVAISLAMTSSAADAATTVVILDEPEQGLHGHAEARLSQALGEVSRELQCMVVAATHSAALLNAPAAVKHHLSVSAEGHTRSLRLLDADLVRSFRDVRYGEQEVGLSAAEILHMIRLFLIVEGPHDQVVLEHLLASDLSAAGAVVLHTAGAKNLPELTRAQLIWDYTDADVVVVLDGIAVAAVLPIWDEAKRSARVGEWKKATAALQALERLPGGEPRWLRELLERALTTGHWERVHPHPLSMPDIICYLPPDALGLSAGWDDIIKSWQGSARGATPVDLKGWLKRQHGINLGVRSLRKAVQHAVPAREIQDLGVEIRVLAGMRDLDSRA